MAPTPNSRIPRADAPDGGLGHALGRAAQLLRVETARALAPLEVTPTQFSILIAIHRSHRLHHRGPTQAAVGEKLDMDKNTVSQVLRGLDRRGLVTREPDPDDARIRRLGLTTAGTALTLRCAELARATNRTFFSVVGDADAALGEVLIRLIDAAQERR